jgi:S-(hydroxymethyl)glutathione dehydrogenase / alcohol dehydrogenase
MVEIKSTGICHTDEYTRSGEDPQGLFPTPAPMHEGRSIRSVVVY